jgi:hypothetical protein
LRGGGLEAAEIRKTPQESADRDLGFQAGELRAKTEMHTVTERQVRVGVATDIELVRVIKLRRGSIGRRERDTAQPTPDRMWVVTIFRNKRVQAGPAAETPSSSSARERRSSGEGQASARIDHITMWS